MGYFWGLRGKCTDSTQLGSQAHANKQLRCLFDVILTHPDQVIWRPDFRFGCKFLVLLSLPNKIITNKLMITKVYCFVFFEYIEMITKTIKLFLNDIEIITKL